MAVVPTYNEVANLEILVRGLRDVEPGIGIVIVDDGSVDGTAQLAHRLAGEVGDIAVIDRPAKLGLGSAYRRGIAHAIEHGADVCVQIDADLSHDPADLPALLANISHGADLAIGSRYVPGGRIERWPWSRRWLSRWGNRYAAGVLGLAVNDATAGYRAYRCEALRRMNFDTVTADGYGVPDRDDPPDGPRRAARSSSSRSPSATAAPGSPSSAAASCVRRSGWSCACGSTTAATAGAGDVSPAERGRT